MEKIDQKFILFFLLLIAIFLSIYNIFLSSKLDLIEENYYQTKEIVEKIEKLKKEWENSTLTKARVNKFVLAANSAKPSVKNSPKTTKIEITNAPLDIMRYLSNEILVSPVIIKHLNITRKSENGVAITLEVTE